MANRARRNTVRQHNEDEVFDNDPMLDNVLKNQIEQIVRKQLLA